MFRGKKIVVVMPAYNAARTLRQTHAEVMEQEIVDEIILVDDASDDETTTIARTLPNTTVHVQPSNRGYGANQKKCYQLALEKNADITIMVHPDYQYTPKLIPAMAALIASGLYHCVLGSRILGGGALKGGMPLWKYVSNRVLTLIQNLLMGTKLSGIPHWLSRLFPRATRPVATGTELRRLSFRQSNPRPDPRARLCNRRGNLPDQSISRKLLPLTFSAVCNMAWAV